MERGKRKSWAVLIILSVLFATGLPVDARSLRASKPRDDLSPPSITGRNSNHREPSADVELLTAGLQELGAAASVLMDANTGTLLFAKNSRERLPPASTTKIMTALLILEEGRLDDWVVITERAVAAGGTGLGLRRGQRVTLRDLLWAVLLRSANDAALAAAEHVGGTTEWFVARMNAKAAALEMQGTRFANPHGLDDPDHYSTAHDLALLTRQALHNPTFSRMVQTREARLSIQTGPKGRVVKRRLLRTHNRLLGQFFGADGVKTGYTERAGRCLVASASRGAHQLIAVLLNDTHRWTDAEALLEYGFAALGGQVPKLKVYGVGSGDIQKGEGG
ncbi:MAG: D-alanyl-D-alanine carboxypeptidase [Candidatus Methylomirabilis oxyfera]|nr:D-alanyl-D-alanine carboxypeptidase [Candidatus Methylomirabilis oxyfera]